MDTMLALRDPGLPVEEKSDALNHLLHMEALNIVYALPALVDGILVLKSKRNIHTEEELSGQTMYTTAIKTCIRSTVHEITRNDYLQVAVENMDHASYEQLAQCLRNIELPSEECEYSGGYLELESCAAEILVLSLLRAAAREVPEEIQEIVDPGTQKPWFTAALHGALGELPWALAVETLSLYGVSAGNLLSYFPKDYWLCCPDKMEAAARIFFPYGSGDVNRILRETFDMKQLTDLYARTVNNAVSYTGLWLDTGMDKEQQKRYVAVLWQVTLWGLAVERDPNACMQLFPSYWGIPLEATRTEQRYRLNRVFQQILAKNRGVSLLADARLAVCSPWLLRKMERNNAHEKIPLMEYPELQQRHLALRAFAVPAIMCRLLRALPKDRIIPAYFLRLLLCYGDAFEFRTIRWIYYRLQDESSSPSNRYTPAIYSLLLCAYGAVRKLGTGQIDSRIPGQLVDLIKKESPVLNREYRQLRPHRNLFSESAFITAAHWAHESLSDVTFTHGIEENPWLCGGYASNGAQVCRWFFNEVWDYVEGRAPNLIQRNAREATQLAFQVLPDILNQSGRKVPGFISISDHGDVSTQDLLLSDEISYEDWERCAPITAQRFGADAYAIALSLRLRALLTRKDDLRPDLSEDIWVSEWDRFFYSIQSKMELSRVCRYLISGFFTLPVSGRGQASTLLDTCRLIINTIVEFSNDAPFYLQHLAEELSRTFPIGDTSAAMLRQSFLAALAQYAEQEKSLLPAERKKTQLLPYYMMMIADQFQSDPLYARQMQNQRNIGRLSAFRCESEPLSAVSPERFLNHALYHRKEDTLQGLSANIQMPFFARLHNRFLTGAAAPEGDWQLGIVLSIEEDFHTREACLSLNLGSGQAEEIRCPLDRKCFHKGDLVAVKQSIPPEIALIRYVNSRTDLAQAKEFDIESSRVKVKIGGHRHDSAHREQPLNSKANLQALRTWSPDVCAFRQAPQEAEYHGGDCLVFLKKFEDGSSFWMPEEQDFLMLLAKRLLSPKHPEREVSLVYIEQSAHDYLFSAAPGENYRLTEDVWEADSLRVLQNELSNYGMDEACGLRIRVRLTMDKQGAPHVALAGQDAFDDTNLRFQSLFQDNQPLTIRRDGAKWMVPLETNEGAAAVTAELVRMPSNFQEMRDADFAEAQVERNGWDLIAQRKGCLRVTALAVQQLTPDLLSKVQLEYFLELRAGARVRLEQIDNRSLYGYYTGKLASGIQVRVAAESVSWESCKITPDLFSNREAIVENVHPLPERSEAGAVPCRLPVDELSGHTHMKGIISRIADVLNVSQSKAENLCVDVNVLIDGKAILLKKIPRSAFSPAPKKIGDIFEAAKSADGWTFQIKPRDVSVRALWKMTDHAEESEPRVTGLFLKMANVHGYGMRTVTQDLRKPVLHLWSPVVRSILKDTIPIGEGKAQCIGRRFSNLSIFKWSFNTEIIRLTTAKGEYIGEAPVGTFPRSLTNWNNCQLQIHSVSHGQDGFQYDLRRIFTAELVKQHQKEEDNLERLAQWQSRYNEWCEAGDFHEVGALRRNADGQMTFHMNDLRLPPDGSSGAPLEAWTDTVPLLDAAPLVSGRNYDARDARAYLHLRNGAWEASIRDARSMSLEEFARYFNVSPPGRSLSVPMVFAGCDEEDHLVFEWGYGFTLVVSPDQVEIEQAAYGAHDLFFGDRIKGFTLELRKEDGNWLLRIPHKKISYEIEGRVWRDALAGVVQQLKVRRVSSKDTVNISKVSVSMSEIDKAVREGRHWDFCTIHNAVLDAPGAGHVLDTLPDTEEAIVLARLDITEDERHLKILHFTIICGEPEHDLREGDILCLEAGAIEPKVKDESPRIGNDYRITFFIPQETGVSMSRPLQVHVQRRYFSYDESILRIQYRKDPMAYSGHYMMVQLSKKPASAAVPPVWQGSVIHAIHRPENRLYDWVKAKDLQEPMVTLGEKDDGRTPVEIAPGIISHIAAQPDFEPGMLAVLRIEDGTLRAERVLLGDSEYIPEQGRPVELLIMDGTWRKPEEGSSRPIKFTIAGLPQVMFPDSSLMKREMGKAPPRFAFLRSSGTERKTYHVDDSVPVLAGYLHCEAENAAPCVVPVSAQDESYIHSWRQLSYLDGTVKKIYAHARRGKWHYHERFTGILYDEQQPPKKVLWPKGSRFDQIPLLFAQGWRLRYTPEELPQYVFSARAVIESGLPEDGGWYPVACSTASSLYIELLPGKIVDVPNSMLVVGKKEYNLSHAYMKAFAPGDQVKLVMAQGPVGTRAKLQLADFRFGLRGTFAEGGALLLARTIADGGLSLGSSTWSITVPCEEGETWNTGDLVALRPDQPLKKILSSSEITEGDTILIAWRNGRFFIPGFPERGLWINHDRNPSDNWIDQLLADAPEKLFALLPTLPVRVKRSNLLNQRTHIWFAYEQPALDGLTPGCQLPCTCVGELPDGASENRPILMRSGAHLFKADGSRLLPGMSPEKRSEAVRFIAEKRTALWMYLDEEGWTTGLAGRVGEYRRIQLLAPLPKAQGFLGQEQDTLSLCWLPAEEASRAKGADAEVLYRILPQECMAVVREDQTVSMIQTQESRLQFESLGANDRQFRVIPKYLVTRDDESGQSVFHYLCQRYPRGDIFWLTSERELRQEYMEESPVPAEIVQKNKQNMEVVPVGMRRVPLDLSSWILAGLRDPTVSNEDSFHPDRFKQAVPERFEKYKLVIQNAESIPLGDFTNPKANCETKLLALFVTYLRNRREMGRSLSYVKSNLADWLEEIGTILAAGTDVRPELDLLPTIAAILLMSAMSEQKEELSGLTVHLTRMLGNLAGGNIHQEILLEHWLLSQQAHPQSSLWSRLNRLQLYGQTISGGVSDKFDGMLTQKQVFSLTSTCNSILGRNSIPGRDHDPRLTTVARALLFAIGAESDYEPLYHSTIAKRTCCSQIYQLGKALTPGRGRNLAIERLANAQIDILNEVFSQLRRQDAPPITLSTRNMYPISFANRKWAAEKCDEAIKLLKDML